MTRKELIRKLLLTSHLSDPERRMFHDEPVRIEEAKGIIKEELKKHRFFPPVTDTWDNSKFYHEGMIIEERGTRYLLHEQASGSAMDLLFSTEVTFDSIDEAIEKYLRPGHLDMDGITILQ